MLALKVAEELSPNANIVTVFPDRMERYFSHKIFDTLKKQTDDEI